MGLIEKERVVYLPHKSSLPRRGGAGEKLLRTKTTQKGPYCCHCEDDEVETSESGTKTAGDVK